MIKKITSKDHLEQQIEDKPKNIVLAYCWGTNNVGDKAITPGMLNLLYESYPKCNITLISFFPDTSNKFQNSAVFIKKKHPNIAFIPNILPLLPFSTKYVGKYISGFLNLIAQLFSLLFPKLSLHIFNKNIGLKQLAKSDLVISNCGHIFFWNKRMKSLKYTLTMAYPLLIAKHLGIPYGFYAQSFGPFEFGYFDGLIKGFYRWLFLGSRFIYTRESESQKEIGDLICKSKCDLATVLDAAFFLRGQEDQKAKAILNKYNLKSDAFIAMTLRLTKRGSSKPLEGELYKRYDRKLSQFIVQWVERKGIPIAIVCQVPADIKDSKFVYEHLPNKYKDYCRIITEKLSPEALKSLYKNARILLGMRFHSLIFALSENTPVVGLYYSDLGPKIPGMMRDLGFQNYVYDIKDISGEDLFKSVNEINQNKDSISKEIEQKLIVMKKQSLDVMKKIKCKIYKFRENSFTL